MYGLKRLCVDHRQPWLFCLFLGVLLWATWGWANPTNPPLDPPTFVNMPRLYVVEGERYSEVFEVWARGWRAEQVAFKLSGPKGMQLTTMGRRGCCSWRGVLTWRPTQADVSSTGHRVSIEAQLPSGQTTTQNFFLYVLERNDPPIISSTPTDKLNQGVLWQYQIQATDPDPTGDTLRYRLLQGPVGMTMDKSGLLQWKPDGAQAGSFSVALEVTDGRGGQTLQQFILEVAVVQQAPAFRSTPLKQAVVGIPYVYEVRADDPNPDDVVQYSLVTGPPGMKLAAPHSLQWLPAAPGTFSVKLEVTDLGGNKAIQSFQINVSATASRRPQITSLPTVGASAGKLWSYDARATDPDGDSVSFALVDGPKGMTLTPKGNGAATLHWTAAAPSDAPQPPSGQPWTWQVVIRADDGKGGVSWQRFVLQLPPTPEKPKIVSAAPSFAVQGELWRYQVQAKSAVGGLAFSLNQAPTGMQIEPATGLLWWRPEAAQVGPQTIEVVVEDRNGARGTQLFSLDVIDRNEPPVITSALPTFATEGQKFTHQLTAKDPDGTKDALGFRWRRHHPAMKLDAKTGLISWTPTQEDVGKHSIVVEVYDAKGGASTQTFTLEVKAANAALRVISVPIESAQVGVLYMYQIRVVAVGASQSPSRLQFSLLQGPQGLKLDPLTGRLTWTPQAEDAGTDQKPVKVVISDRSAALNHSFSIRVFAKNQPPVVSSETSLQAKEGVQLTHQIKATDPDGDKLSYQLEVAPDGLNLDVATGALTWRPASYQVGIFGVQVRVDDKRGGVVMLRISIEVADQPNPPMIVSQPPIVAVVGKPFVYAPHAMDPDEGTLLRWSLGAWPSGMTLDATTGRVAWTPTAAQVGRHDVTLKVSDGADASANEVSQSFQVWVQHPDQPPTWKSSAPPGQAQQSVLYVHRFEAVDADTGDALAYRLVEGPQGATIDPYTGLFQWRPGSDQVGSHPCRVEARDRQGHAITQSFTLQVSAKNQPPQLVGVPLTVAAVGQTYLFDIQAIDPNGDAVALSLSAGPTSAQPAGRMILDAAKGQLVWTPEASHAGKSHLVSIKATDGKGGETFQHFVIDVIQGANQPPSWKSALPSGVVTIPEKQLYQLTLAATDPDGDALLYRLASGPAGMWLTPQGTLGWVPGAAQIGSHTAQIEVSDGKGGVLRSSLQLKVTNQNDPPIIASLPDIRVQAGQRFAYQLKLDDPDIGVDPQEQLTLLLSIAPPGMTLDPMARSLEWSPKDSDIGSHVVQVRVRDRAGLAATQLFRVIVEARDVAPQIVSTAPTQATEGQWYQYQVELRDDNDAGPHHFQLLNAPEGMSIEPRLGLISWLPTNRDARLKQANVEIMVTDSGGGQGTQRFTLQVADVNEPPRFVSPPCREALTGVYNCVLLVEDRDPLPWQLTATKVIGPDGLQVQVAKGTSGQRVSLLLKWSPAPEDVGSHLVALEVSDGAATASSSFHIVVSSNNDAPIADPGRERDFAIDPGEVTLDGSLSRDAKGDKTGLTYQWSLLQGPEEVKIETPNTPKIQPILRTAGAYIFQLVVTKGEKQSAPAQVRVSVRNIPPTASVHGPTGANIDRTIQLDATDSDDANADALLFRWSQTEGPTVALDQTDPKKPTFAPTKPGLYQFTLVVEEDRVGGLRSQPATVDVAVHAPGDAENGVYIPHAVITAPTIGIAGTTLTLDGSRSRGLAAERLKTGLTYEWRLLDGPSTGGLATPKQAKTQFLPQRSGLYQIGLIVRNNLHRSIEAKHSIFIRDKGEQPLPVAVPAKRYATFMGWSALDGSQSRDPAGKQLSFAWSQQLSSGGLPVTLRDARSSKPSFFALSRAPYFFQLQVQADGPDSVPVPFVVLVNQPGNRPPVANAGEDRADDKAVMAGQVTTLDGSQSQDPDSKEALQYRWRQTGGFPIALQGDDKATLSFVPITYGILTFSLQVYDGKAWSWADPVQVVVHDETNHVPQADPGPDQKVLLQQSVTLDGSKSRDLDPNDELTFHWRLIEPQGTQIAFDQVDPRRPRFTVKDRNIARYVFGLVVDDGKARSLERRVTVEVLNPNKAPIARIDGVTTAFVEEEITLDGRNSFDDDGDKLSYYWKQVSGWGKPLTLSSTQESQLKVRFPEEGTYKFELKVYDGNAYSAAATITIEVKKRSPDDAAGCGCQSRRDDPTPALGLGLLLLFLWWQRRRPHPQRR